MIFFYSFMADKNQKHKARIDASLNLFSSSYIWLPLARVVEIL